MKPDLNSAIDQVAERMVAVPDDPEMVARIVNALPERSSRLGWLIPGFAAISALVIAAIVWSLREHPALTPVLPSDAIAAWAMPPIVVAREPGTSRTRRTLPSEPPAPPAPPEPLVSSADFDRSLPPIESVTALTLTGTETTAIALPDPIGLPPIEITDLKLTAESFSSQKEE